ncbi:MAG: sulfite exporter TauE/SafE family protein [Flavobacteriales bacterium]|nr:sulfite exporter TauE/SafE family protein [Flavobacteriales bacterium]
MVFLAFGIGLMSSFHCLGMCGPIAMAAPVITTNGFTEMLSRLAYNLGRIFSYSIIGLLMGLLGNVVLISGIQQSISIISGVFILLSLIPFFNIEHIVGNNVFHFFQKIRRPFQQLFKQKKLSSVFMLGLLNGFIPCGMVYMAAAGAFAGATFINGMIFMIFFGLGTLPMLYLASAGFQVAGPVFRSKIKNLMPVLVGLIGILFILRGLNLGIPVISPKFAVSNEITTCE